MVQRYKGMAMRLFLIMLLGTAMLAASCSAGPPSTATPATTSPATTNTPTASPPPITVQQKCDAPTLNDIGHTPELAGIENWINSEPITIAGELAKNQVVLIDFWTYTCVNCLRTLPFLREWYDKYNDKGLTIIGVHTPEFEFEKLPDNVAEASAKEGVVWPVAQDNNYATWDNFVNRFWPAKYLLIPNRGIVYAHFGEGAYCETEQAIREALTSVGRDVTDIPAGQINNPTRDSTAFAQTRELYGGTLRSTPTNPYVGNLEFYTTPLDFPTVEFVDPGEYRHEFFYLHGRWQRGRESITHARTTENLEDYIALTMLARSANVVVPATDGNPYQVHVYLDDKPLNPEEAGTDIIFTDSGESVVLVTEPRLYNLVQQPTFNERTLKLASNSTLFSVFAFTFGNYETGF